MKRFHLFSGTWYHFNCGMAFYCGAYATAEEIIESSMKKYKENPESLKGVAGHIAEIQEDGSLAVILHWQELASGGGCWTKPPVGSYRGFVK